MARNEIKKKPAAKTSKGAKPSKVTPAKQTWKPANPMAASVRQQSQKRGKR